MTELELDNLLQLLAKLKQLPNLERFICISILNLESLIPILKEDLNENVVER